MRVPYSLPFINDDVINEVNDVFNNTGWLTSGPKVLEFEKEIQKITKSKNVVCVNSWTSGLIAAVGAIGIEPGDEVICPNLTFIAPVNMIALTGAKPVLVDIEPNSWAIDHTLVAEAITERTKAIVIVHLYGFACDFTKIIKFHNS